MKARRRINRIRLTNTLGWLAIAIGLLAAIYDVITNKVNGIWLILYFVPMVGVFILTGIKETVIGIAVIVIGGSFWQYLEFLQEQISGIEIDMYQSVLGRIGIVIIAFSVTIFFRWFFIQPIKEFFQTLWEMISLPRVSKALVYLVISYTSITVLFGVAYATIYVFLGTSTFQSNEPLHLSDFIYYSIFIPTTLGYPNISPVHWSAKLLTMLEFLFGITVIVIYLGAIVGTISEHFSQRKAG